MTDGVYHKLLRVSLIVVALMLLFDGGFVAPLTKTLSENTYVYLSNSVGVFVGVEQNEINTLTAALTERTQALNERERVLQEREIATRDFGGGSNDYSVYMLSLILFVLTLLILTNYALDWRRARRTFA